MTTQQTVLLPSAATKPIAKTLPSAPLARTKGQPRTKGTYVRTPTRLNEITRVPDAANPVDNRESAVLEILDHTLAGVDHSHELCSCGVSSTSWLEHLGDVARALMGAKPRDVSADVRAAEDAAWESAQLRKQNLASFQVQPKPKRARWPKFTPSQLAVADRWAAGQNTAA